MKILIIEDEENAAIQLMNMIRQIEDSPTFSGVIDNIEDAVDFLSARPDIDLIFLDIHLSDGSSFEIFKEVKVDIPIIFTTAYDQYAIQSFEVNSIDYLLKPIRLEKLIMSIEKFRRLNDRQTFDGTMFQKLSRMLNESKNQKRNFLIPLKGKLIPVSADDFAWFEISDGVVTGTKFDQTPLVMEQKSLEELVEDIDPTKFFRANRQYLINREAIKEIEYYFNGRLFARLFPAPKEKVLISKAKATEFKEWLSMKTT